MECLRRFFIIWTCFVLLTGSQYGYLEARRIEHICDSKNIRNVVEAFKELENCTVIEGNLSILLIENAHLESYDNLRFPKLVEITDYLLLYRVYKLKTLAGIFPNLAVIKGQNLFYNYAVVAFEVPDLEELGLPSLVKVVRGAIRLEKNPQLCYIDTIDWSRITNKHSIEDFENKRVDECVNVCPKTSTGGNKCPNMTLASGEKQPLCWNGDRCQRVCDNPNCGDQGCYTYTGQRGRKETACCHEECLGGCTGPKATHCTVCKHVFSNGRCQHRCHIGTYLYQKRRCVTAEACRAMDQKQLRPKYRHNWKVDTVNRECILQCPANYTEAKDDPHKCVRCAGRCPKVCDGLVIDSVAAAQKMKGCTVILGILEIQIIRGGSHVGRELEENLGLVEEVTNFVKIIRSYAIMSLSFLKNLKVIRGVNLFNNRYALYVDDNRNLQAIWDFSIHPKLTISNGTVLFNNNRRLCPNEIYQLANSTNFGNKKFKHVDPKDITSTNGDNAACNVTELELELIDTRSTYALVKWKNFQTADSRSLLSWSVNYKEAPSRNVTIFNSRDACSDDMWKTDDVKPSRDTNETYMAHFLATLKPFTQYAVYVQTYTISVGNRGAISPILYFKTEPDAPTYPQDLKVEVPRVGDMLVKWKPPNKPGGPVNHYYVYYQPEPLKAERFDRRDYCTDTLRLPSMKKPKEPPPDKTNVTIDGQCCACPKSKADLKKQEDERMFQIHFEDFLHNRVYQKRPVSVSKAKSTPTQLRRKRRSRAEYRSLPGEKPNRMNKNETSSALNVSKPDSDENYILKVVHGTEILLTNLSHFQEYSIEVIACHDDQSKYEDTKRKMCSNRAITTARTLPLETADNIDERNITAYNDSAVSGRVWVKWAPPVTPNGLIVAYDIALKKVEVADIKEDIYCLTHKKHREDDGYRINSLSPGNWSFRIRATSLAGNGSWTKEMYFYVVDYDTPEGVKAELIAGVTVSIAFVLLLVIGGVIWAVAKNRFNAGRGLLIASFNPDYWSAGNIYVPDEWEVPREKIKLVRELGQGSFGMVYEGISTDLNEEHMGEFNVAVKTVNETASLRERIEFLNEASVMKAFKCNHVVRLMGVVSKGQPTLVVMELMMNGDLKSFLRLFRPDNEENINNQPPTLKEILEMAGEIADGMAYLAAKKFVHRDLAARNCMVSENMVVKIGDFGMTRDIYETDYYKKGGKGLLPVRWMAPESLKDGIFTSLSDVWSYGVVLWEMATLAAQPYQGFANEQVLRYVIDGGIMELPENCPEKLFNLMLMCWKLNPKQRPTFCQIIEILIPDLNIDFEKVSYFFSEENQLNMHSGSDKGDDASSVLDYDDARTPLTASPSLHRSVGQLQDLDDMADASRQSSLSYETNRPQLSADPDMTRCDHRNQCDCVEIAGHEPWVKQSPATAVRRDSRRSSQGSNAGGGVIVSNEGSKGSSKSSSSSHGLNGIPNGRIPMYIVPPRS